MPGPFLPDHRLRRRPALDASLLHAHAGPAFARHAPAYAARAAGAIRFFIEAGAFRRQRGAAPLRGPDRAGRTTRVGARRRLVSPRRGRAGTLGLGGARTLHRAHGPAPWKRVDGRPHLLHRLGILAARGSAARPGVRDRVLPARRVARPLAARVVGPGRAWRDAGDAGRAHPGVQSADISLVPGAARVASRAGHRPAARVHGTAPRARAGARRGTSAHLTPRISASVDGSRNGDVAGDRSGWGCPRSAGKAWTQGDGGPA